MHVFKHILWILVFGLLEVHVYASCQAHMQRSLRACVCVLSSTYASHPDILKNKIKARQVRVFCCKIARQACVYVLQDRETSETKITERNTLCV
jgi:hypothetical protein